jgi:hypothetical protein
LGTPDLESGDHKPKVALCKVQKLRCNDIKVSVGYAEALCQRRRVLICDGRKIS